MASKYQIQPRRCVGRLGIEARFAGSGFKCCSVQGDRGIEGRLSDPVSDPVSEYWG
jgi:hypothetical protein